MPIPGLWVPPSADPMLAMRNELDAERRAYAESAMGQIEHLRAELRRIDPYLTLERVHANAPDDDPATIPGYWHIVRHNPGAPDTWEPITGEHGEYVEPTSRIFDKLAEGDMWRDDYGRRARKRQARAAADRERDKERRRAAKALEFNERAAAATQVRISFDRDHRWTQNTAGRRAASERPTATTDQ